MTIYKPLRTLASGARACRADGAAPRRRRRQVSTMAMAGAVGPLRRGDSHARHMLDTVVRDGQATYDDVYRGIPDARRPPRP